MEPGNRFFTTPTIYIEETSQAFRVIEPFPETMAVFIGYTQSGADHLLQAVSISSVQEYTTTFGEAGQTTMQVDLTTDEPPQILSMTIAATPFPMFYHMQLYFANGGRKCWVISIGNDYTQKALGATEENPSGFLGGLQVAETIKDANLLVIPEATGLSRPDYSILIQAMLAHCARSSNRFAIIDVYGATELVPDTLEQHRLAVGSEYLRYGASYFPYVITNYIPQVDPSYISYNEAGNSDRRPKLLVDHPFVDELTAAIRTWLNNQFLVLPPCAAVAGAIARVDREKGIWKSPANIVIENVKSPAVILNEHQQQAFNIDVINGISINVIRFFQGRGTLIWGARTMQGNNAEWRYIAVQRFVKAVEAAVQKALAPFIFEPNESSAWIKIQTLIENFLVQQWKQGALQGMTTKEAFYVHVGPGQTMTQEDVVQGRMIVEVGMALLRPVEFIILRFHQQTRV